MNIYFAGSIRGGRDDAELYQWIVELLLSKGTVLTEHVAQSDVFESEKPMKAKEIYERDMDMLKKADVVIAEVTTPSLGVGFELAKAMERNLPILCLHRISQEQVSAMVTGAPGISLAYYESFEEARQAIEGFI